MLTYIQFSSIEKNETEEYQIALKIKNHHFLDIHSDRIKEDLINVQVKNSVGNHQK